MDGFAMALRGAVLATSVLAGSAAAALAHAQEPSRPPEAMAPNAAVEVEAVVVTGYRASLLSALEAKRREAAIVDVIDAEGIADFPDLNLAEALQRLPGVAVDREAGEGRSITVRGLSPDFTRVRIDGLEALATTGGKDLGGGGGGANRGRGFDFQVFASELFSRVTVRKSQSAEVEEGSLGATVDLRPARPFDHDGFRALTGVQVGYNDLSGSVDPRYTALLSHVSSDRRLGALLSLAYSTRSVREEISASGRWENPRVAGNSMGCWVSPGPCDPATGQYSDVNSAWHARIPRYGRLDHDWTRIGATASLQWRPGDRTEVTLGGLYARTDGERREDYLQAFLSRPGASVRSGTIDGKGQLIAAVLDDVDVHTLGRYDVLTSDFVQASVQIDHRVTDRLTLSGALGGSESIQDNPVQTSLSFDRYNVDGYAYDFSGDERRPAFAYGFDVTDPGQWMIATTAALGDPSILRMRPNRTENRLLSARLDAALELGTAWRLKAGALVKAYTFETEERRRFRTGNLVDAAVALPAGVTLAEVSRRVTGFGRGLGMPAGTPRTWLAPDVDRLIALFDIHCDCVNSFGDFRVSIDNQRGGNREVIEDDFGAYLQADFDDQLAGLPVRGDVGVRYVVTRSEAAGYVGATLTRVARRYADLLPAFNLVLEPREDLLVRFSAARVMSRPQLPFLSPGGSISNTARTLSVGNPLLDPIRATAVDMNVEWYGDGASSLVVGLFYKDLESYIQSSIRSVPFAQTGFPTSLLFNGNTGDTPFTVIQFENTSGGGLHGLEASYQRTFDGLPAPWNGLGVVANLTLVDSEVDYITDASTVPPSIMTLPLANLSATSWNLTLFYEDDRFSGRLAAAWRDSYLASVPGGNGNDARGKAAALTLDLSLALRLGARTTLTFEGLNLLDTFEDRWISLERDNSEEFGHTGRQIYLGLRHEL